MQQKMCLDIALFFNQHLWSLKNYSNGVNKQLGLNKS